MEIEKHIFALDEQAIAEIEKQGMFLVPVYKSESPFEGGSPDYYLVREKEAAYTNLPSGSAC